MVQWQNGAAKMRARTPAAPYHYQSRSPAHHRRVAFWSHDHQKDERSAPNPLYIREGKQPGGKFVLASTTRGGSTQEHVLIRTRRQILPWCLRRGGRDPDPVPEDSSRVMSKATVAVEVPLRRAMSAKLRWLSSIALDGRVECCAPVLSHGGGEEKRLGSLGSPRRPFAWRLIPASVGWL